MPPLLIWPRAGSNIRGLHITLHDVANELNGMTGGDTEILPTCLRWALRSTSRLQTRLVTEDVDRLIRTPTFWAALQLNPTDEQAQYLINIEKEDRRNYLNEMVGSIAAFQRRFENVPETAFVLVLDTSMVIRCGDAFSKANWRALSQTKAYKTTTPCTSSSPYWLSTRWMVRKTAARNPPAAGPATC